ncbi:MAG: L,D-transpeptidase [Rhizobiales bacterium]|nr:L,D-transpeptidase [Hyphomicrobiales bacterium]
MKRLIIAIAAISLLPLWLALPAQAQQTKVFSPTTRTYITINKYRARGGKLSRKYKRKEVRFRSSEPVGTIVINPKKKYLYLVTKKNRAIRYGIGVGREGFGWKGTVNIKRKAKWPAWHPPAEMIIRERKENGRKLPRRMAGGPENPLGARALYLFKGNRDTLYRIHGTNEPWTIGSNVSSGCIRLINKDVEHLFERVKLGAKVVVL